MDLFRRGSKLDLYYSEIEVSLYSNQEWWVKQNETNQSNLGWVWMNYYPFGYSHNEQNWIYFTAKNKSPIYSYGSWNSEWKEFGQYLHHWDKQYERWIDNPTTYGGIEVLKEIKIAKLDKSSELTVNNTSLSDLNPLVSLKDLDNLSLKNNNISDITPINGLSGLRSLGLSDNHVSDLLP